MDLPEEVAAPKLTNDLVVDILSRLPYKSFCRCKCVNKSWSAFSSDPDYRKNLPKKVTAGLLYQGYDKSASAIPLVSLCPDDGEIDGILADVPHHEHLELLDCCNGLVLCKYRSSYTSKGICRFVVCNPATREWRILPDTHPGTDDPHYETILAFDPSWSPQFYIFNFHLKHFMGVILGTNKLQIFRSESSTWLEGDTLDPNINVSRRAHLFVNGMLYVNVVGEVLVFKGLEAMSDDIPPYHQTIRLPPEASHMGHFTVGCFGKSSGILHYAMPHVSGRSIVVWTLEDSAHNLCTWTVKCHLSMTHAFGKDELVHYGAGAPGAFGQGLWNCDYWIVDLDLERELVFLYEKNAKKILSYNISTGNSMRYKTTPLRGIGTVYMYHATQSFQPKNLRLSECQLLFNLHLRLFLRDMLNHQSWNPAVFTLLMHS